MSNRAERRRQERQAKKIRKTLTSGDGIFWDLKSDGIHLKSEEEVAKALGVKLSGRHVDIPVDLISPLNEKQRMHIFRLVAMGKTEEKVLQEIRGLLKDTPLTISREERNIMENGEFSKHRVVDSCQRLLKRLNPLNKVKTLYNVKTVNNL